MTCPVTLDIDNGVGGWLMLACDLAPEHIAQHHDPRGLLWTPCQAGHRHQP